MLFVGSIGLGEGKKAECPWGVHGVGEEINGCQV